LVGVGVVVVSSVGSVGSVVNVRMMMMMMMMMMQKKRVDETNCIFYCTEQTALTY